MQATIPETVRRLLEGRPKILLAWIYGSFATGREQPGSDVDIAVACASPLSVDEKVQLAQELSTAAGREVDLVDMSAERGIIASQVLTQGKLLLRRDPNLLAALMRRMWYDRADFWPLRERIFAARRRRAFGEDKG